jgi:tetratricopeptide (TPR) repeat protein
MIILYKEGGGEAGRQIVSNGSRYRFNNLVRGDYELLIQSDNNEVGRVKVVLSMLSNSPYGFQYDLDFAWKGPVTTPGTISAADVYNRPASTQPIFVKAEEAVGKKKYDQAVTLLKQVVETDNADFQAWGALGTVYNAQEKFDDAQQAYQQAVAVKPASPRAHFNLGRFLSSQKKYEEALEPLTKAVELQPTSGDANLLLGEAYLQVKKGSKAIPYLNAAAGNGRPEAHLRLGWLYNAAGLKDKAAVEYEEYLKKNPDYQDKNKLKEYITVNKKG